MVICILFNYIFLLCLFLLLLQQALALLGFLRFAACLLLGTSCFAHRTLSLDLCSTYFCRFLLFRALLGTFSCRSRTLVLGGSKSLVFSSSLFDLLSET